MVIIDRANLKTSIARKYYDLLYDICKKANTDYLFIGLFTRLKEDADRQKMIDAIESGITDPFDLIDVGDKIRGINGKPLEIMD